MKLKFLNIKPISLIALKKTKMIKFLIINLRRMESSLSRMIIYKINENIFYINKYKNV